MNGLRSLLLPAALVVAIAAAAQEPMGVVRGTVRDAATGLPLAQATVVLRPSEPLLGAATDSAGGFILRQVPVGLYAVKASVVGHEPQELPEVWVRSGKETVVDLALRAAFVQLAPVEVGAVEVWHIPHLGVRTFTVEQGLRYPAMFQDPARLVAATPSVAAPNDQANHLMVRGNSPLANSWLLEGAEIVSPNHLGNAGTVSDLPTLSGGGVSILSAQMLGPSRLRTGILPAHLGNAVGGLMDLELRRGNAQAREWTVQAGLLGIDLSTEGPIGRNGKAFHLVNYRYSTVGLLSAMGVDLGDEAIRFQDLSFHVGTRLGEQGELRLFGMGGTSANVFAAKPDTALWETDKDSRDIDYTSSMGAVGATLRLPLGRRSVLHATAAWSGAYQERTETETDTAARAFAQPFASLYERKLSAVVRVEGALGKRLRYAAGAGAMERTAVNVLKDTTSGWLLRPFAQVMVPFSHGSHLTAGVAWSRFTYSDSDLPEPRIDLFVRTGPRGALMVGAGVRGQLPQHAVMNLYAPSPASLALGVPDNRSIGLQRSEDLVVGYEHRVQANLVVRAEAFAQRLTGVPRPWSGFRGASGLDGALLNFWDQPQYLPMEETAEGRNIGAELSLSRDFSRGYYWLVNGSAFRSTFIVDGLEREGRWSANWTANAIAGKEWRKAKETHVRTWGAGLRALGVGGLRYTPMEAQNRRGIWTFVLGEPYSAKLNDVYRIDLRVYLKRDRPGRTSQWAIDLQNAANTRNEAYRVFDYRQGEFITRTQLGLIPNLSYRIEF